MSEPLLSRFVMQSPTPMPSPFHGTPARKPAERAAASRHGFTLIEILTVVAIVAVLIALIVPVVQGMRSRAQAAQCISHLRADFLGLNAYFGDHQNTMPMGPDGAPLAWYSTLFTQGYLPWPSGVTAKTIHDKTAPTLCPANPVPRNVSNAAWTNYGINGTLYQYYGPSGGNGAYYVPRRLTDLKKPKGLLIDMWKKDGNPFQTWYYGNSSFSYQSALHGKSVNVLFTDGHIESPIVDPPVKNAAGDLGQLRAEWFQFP